MADEELQEDLAVDAAEEEKNDRLQLSVDISDSGPCQKHIRISIPRSEVDRVYDKEFVDLVRNAAVPGFRPGKTPRKLIERRFKKDVSSRVKADLLLRSFEQVFDDEKIDALDQPNIDIESIELPDEGDFVYELDVEVRPEFDLPDYKGLELEKPVREFTDEDVEQGLQRFLKTRGSMTVKDGPAEEGDYVVADMRFTHEGRVIGEFSAATVQVQKTLYFSDGRIEGFSEGITGAKAGDSRDFEAIMSDTAADESLQGKAVQVAVVVQQVKQLTLPELNQEFFNRIGVGDEAELRDAVKASLESRFQYQQSQRLIGQIVEKLLADVNFDLPRDLLRRQSEKTLRNKIAELQSAGFSEEEIRAHTNRLRQDSITSTANSLRQQFILQKIAEVEDITVDQEDLEDAVRDIADRTGESYRRVRARVEKDQLWEPIALQVLQRKTIDKIVSYANVKEVPYVEEETASSGLDQSAVQAPAEEPSEESAKAESGEAATQE